jgi:acetyltransferase-like isoleucine patch superfamily enzyme
MEILKKVYGLSLKCKHYKHKALTIFWYNIFLRKSSSTNLIINPILLSCINITLEKRIVIRNGCRIEAVIGISNAVPQVIIENNVNIEQNAHITCGNFISIGENTSLAACVTISDIIHNFENVEISPKFQPLTVFKTTIGKNCIINNNAVILPGALIGNHVVVAANSVVRAGTYPNYCVLAGSPAKIVKQYDFDKQIWNKITE